MTNPAQPPHSSRNRRQKPPSGRMRSVTADELSEALARIKAPLPALPLQRVEARQAVGVSRRLAAEVLGVSTAKLQGLERCKTFVREADSDAIGRLYAALRLLKREQAMTPEDREYARRRESQEERTATPSSAPMTTNTLGSPFSRRSDRTTHRNKVFWQ